MNELPPEYENTPKSWKELETWAVCNHPGWHRIYCAAKIHRQDEHCTMRQLVAHLLTENIKLKKMAVETAMNFSAPSFILPGNPLPAHLQPDAPHLQCTICGRKSYGGSKKGMLCDMMQPDEHRCAGILV